MHYDSLAGHLIGSTNGSTTTSYLTDAEGSLLTSLSASAITGEQLSAPYGTTRYTVGSLGTAKALTGQEADALTGLSYYHARWYDPVVGMFVSVDPQEGNAQGVDPYAYGRGNPETWTDPTGAYRCGDPNNCNPSPPPTGGSNPPIGPCVLSGGNPLYCGPQGGGGKPSPGTGKPPAPPAPPKLPTKSQIDNAKDDANHAGAVFSGITAILGAIAGSAFKIAPLLEQLAAYLWGVVAGLSASLFGIVAAIALGVVATLVSALAVAFATLAISAAGYGAIAGVVGAEFWYKGSDHDTSVSAWTRSAMENFQNEVDNTIAGGTLVITTFETLYTYATGLFKANSPLSKVMPQGLRELGLPLGSLAVNVSIGGGLLAVANSWIGTMNSDLGYQ